MIALASDHAGYELKAFLIDKLQVSNVAYMDCGCHSAERVDYIPYTLKVAALIADGSCERGIYVCGNGYAMAMLANRIPGMRAAVCHDAYTARTARQMGNANIISIGARVIGGELAWQLTQIWLNSEFSNDERYRRRDEAVKRVEMLIARPDWQSALQNYLAGELD